MVFLQGFQCLHRALSTGAFPQGPTEGLEVELEVGVEGGMTLCRSVLSFSFLKVFLLSISFSLLFPEMQII